MQFHQLRSAARSLAPPEPFPHPRDEADFLAEYIRTGYGFAVVVALAGALISLGFIVESSLAPGSSPHGFELQLLRIVVGMACGLSFFSLLFDPARALRNYQVTIFVPAFVSLVGIGLLLTIARSDDPSEFALGQSLLSLVVAVWLVAAFCRLPLHQIVWMTGIASLLTLLGLTMDKVEHLPIYALNLLIANLIAWALAIHTEKRERLIWHQASRNRNAIRKAKNSARQATVINSAQARLIRSVGDDIRQPLSSSGIYLGLVSRAARHSANEVMEQNLARVKTCLRAVEGTLERLLEPVDDGDDAPLITQPVDLTDLFADLRDVFEPQALRLGVELRFAQTCRTKTVVRTNERAMREVLSNIVANALKYSAIANDRKARVLIGIVQLGDMARVDILDNGIGIDPALHTRIFDEYFRSPAVAGRVRGNGLGLAIVESTIQRLPDHRLRLQSREAEGTRVKIYLPMTGIRH